MSGDRANLPLDIRPQVYADIKGILKHTEQQWGAQQRTKYKQLIDRCLTSIAYHPDPITQSDTAIPGYYRRHLGGRSRHYVFYRRVEDRVLVVRILYDQMDFEQYLPNETEN
jgi:toxin ParE1/3/4